MITFENATRTFSEEVGVTGLTFSVRPGEIVALIGLNGAGKTTLMRLALGMLRPDHGRVCILGTPLPKVRPHTWAQVGALVDTPLAYPELTVRQNLRNACLLHRASTRIIPASLAAWHLDHAADRRFRNLSMGTRQRVGLATALQHNPHVIILDEPSSALDPASQIMLREELLRRAQHGAGILVSSHHLDEVVRIADRVLLMNGGRLLGELTTDEDATASTPAGEYDLERRFFDTIRRDDEHRRAIGGFS